MTVRGGEGPLLPPARLGVLGSGQLGRMFVQAAHRMGFRTVVLSGSQDTPAAQVSDEVVLGSERDLPTLTRFAALAEAVTVEFENVSAPALRWLARRRPVRPGWRTVWISQNRQREKRMLSRFGFPVAPWHAVTTAEQLQAAGRELGVPLILKTSASGYDGKGQVRVESVDGLEAAWAHLHRVPCVAEAVVSFAAELSVVAVRGADGQAAAYPASWNQHARHILDQVVAPAPVGPCVMREARSLAIQIAERLETVGVLTVEFFADAQGGLRVNELAPRPHNSGHLTIESAYCSQFEQQVRVLAGLPLGSTQLIGPAAMVNLLGDLWERGEPDWAAALARDPGVHLHLYGKRSPLAGRKMGHLTVQDPDPRTALLRALAARRTLAREP